MALVLWLVREDGQPVRVIGRRATFAVAATGTLRLRINDRDNNCITDNKGAL